MKKIITALPFLLLSLFVNAQDGNSDYLQQRMLEMFAVLFTFVLIALFVLTLFKRIFDYRLKNKVIDKQVTETMAMSVLGSNESKEGPFTNVKWFALLGGAGAGLLIVNYTQPLGIHSLAIMFLSIAFSFLGYHFYLSRQIKKN